MKIDNEQLLPTLNKCTSEPVGKGDNAAADGQKGAAVGTDRVELTVNKGEIDQLKKTMQEIPDVRSEKVARLREAIAAGTYRVDGKEVAAKMLESWRETNGTK